MSELPVPRFRIVVADTNIVSYLMRGQPIGQQYRELLRGTTICITFTTADELLFGALNRNWGMPRRLELEKTLRGYAMLKPGLEIAQQSARIRFVRKSAGRPISQPDAAIAATALTCALPLVSHDRDFEGIEGLDLVTLRHGPGCVSVDIGYRAPHEARQAA